MRGGPETKRKNVSQGSATKINYVRRGVLCEWVGGGGCEGGGYPGRGKIYRGWGIAFKSMCLIVLSHIGGGGSDGLNFCGMWAKKLCVGVDDKNVGKGRRKKIKE